MPRRCASSASGWIENPATSAKLALTAWPSGTHCSLRMIE